MRLTYLTLKLILLQAPFTTGRVLDRGVNYGEGGTFGPGSQGVYGIGNAKPFRLLDHASNSVFISIESF